MEWLPLASDWDVAIPWPRGEGGTDTRDKVATRAGSPALLVRARHLPPILLPIPELTLPLAASCLPTSPRP